MKHTVTILPHNFIFSVPHGANLLTALTQNGFFIPAACGGRGSCGKCAVKCRTADAEGYQTVLSCHTSVTADLTVLLDVDSESGLWKVSSLSSCASRKAGMILDIGTTTLAACLVDKATGETLAKASALNPQGAFGADVISRISAFGEGKGEEMRAAVTDATNRLIAQFSRTGAQIDELFVVGNPTMLHLFVGIDPTGIGSYPFTPAFTEAKYFEGTDIGIDAPCVRLLPSISAYLGSDVSAGMLTCEMDKTDKTQLFIDLGTNGEIVLAHDGKLYAASTAAGPALEGANLSCGIGGVAGAIDRVWTDNGHLHFTTVDGASARGICGSGLIDLLALLLDEEILDETGTFSEECDSPLFHHLEDNCFYLTPEIYLSQDDVRQFQLAKAAIAAGVEALAAHCGVKMDEIENVFLAGGLGYYMSPARAARTGLMSPALLSRTQIVGNTALAGARLCLLNEEKQTEIDALCKETETVELSFSSVFSQAYIENMGFER
ncbi:MAG: DUF4445 domain-containing protein [Clostridia bacterium]|nr:DUF4445 domain-containing protein [Clostridia bacterium]